MGICIGDVVKVKENYYDKNIAGFNLRVLGIEDNFLKLSFDNKSVYSIVNKSAISEVVVKFIFPEIKQTKIKMIDLFYDFKDEKYRNKRDYFIKKLRKIAVSELNLENSFIYKTFDSYFNGIFNLLNKDEKEKLKELDISNKLNIIERCLKCVDIRNDCTIRRLLSLYRNIIMNIANKNIFKNDEFFKSVIFNYKKNIQKLEIRNRTQDSVYNIMNDF